MKLIYTNVMIINTIFYQNVIVNINILYYQLGKKLDLKMDMIN